MAFIGKQPSKAALTSSDITDGVVTADKLASDSVTTAKIADNGVTTAKINADAVTDAKIADDVVGSEHLTAGEVDTTALGADAVTAAKIADDAISEEHLDVTAVTGHTAETSAADADTIIIHDDSASALRKMTRSNFLSGVGGTNTPAFYANRTSGNQSLSHDTATKVQFNVETFDTDGTYDHSTNYRWTPGVVGKYIIGVGWWCLGNDTGRTFNCYIYKNGSQHMQGISRFNSDTPRFRCNDIFPVDVTSTSDYFEAYAKLETNNGNAMDIHAGDFSNYFYGYKLLT